MNILIAIESFFDGGAEIFAIRLANELVKDHKVFFFELYPHLSVEKRQLLLLDKKIRLIQPGKNITGRILHTMKHLKTPVLRKVAFYYAKHQRKRIIKFIRDKKIEVVNSHSWDSDVFLAEIKKECSFKLISSFHGHYEFVADKRYNYEGITSKTLKIIDKVIYTSPTHQKTLDKYAYPSKQRQKIFYGVSFPKTERITLYKKGECLNLVLTARGIKEKGWEQAIKAVLCLLEKYPSQLKLFLVGEGDYLDSLSEKYNHTSIIFLGYKNDVRPIIEAAHIGLLPSFYVAESLPNSVIEYLFCGKPVIATDIGAIDEMITFEGKKGGFCNDLNNNRVNIEGLTNTIEKYIQ